MSTCIFIRSRRPGYDDRNSIYQGSIFLLFKGISTKLAHHTLRIYGSLRESRRRIIYSRIAGRNQYVDLPYFSLSTRTNIDSDISQLTPGDTNATMPISSLVTHDEGEDIAMKIGHDIQGATAGTHRGEGYMSILIYNYLGLALESTAPFEDSQAILDSIASDQGIFERTMHQSGGIGGEALDRNANLRLYITGMAIG